MAVDVIATKTDVVTLLYCGQKETTYVNARHFQWTENKLLCLPAIFTDNQYEFHNKPFVG